MTNHSSYKHFLILLLIISAVVLSTSYISEYEFKLTPCHLCLYQRYMISITLLYILGVIILKKYKASSLIITGILFFANALTSGYHVLVEQKIIDLPESCQKNIIPSGSFESYKHQLFEQPPVRCDIVQFELFGVSMAGYNFMLCLILSLIIFYYVYQKSRSY